jgi:hypothetical protein
MERGNWVNHLTLSCVESPSNSRHEDSLFRWPGLDSDYALQSFEHDYLLNPALDPPLDLAWLDDALSEQAQHMPPPKTTKARARTLREVDWEPYKSRIIYLQSQKRPLKEIMAVIEEEYGFFAELRVLEMIVRLEVLTPVQNAPIPNAPQEMED